MSDIEFKIPPINSAAARDAERAEYLDVRMRMEGCDEPSIGRALLLVAELHGMSRVAQACGVSVVTLRRRLNGTRPLYLETVLGVMRAMNLQLRVEDRVTAD
jgi:DNA-binding phage protein